MTLKIMKKKNSRVIDFAQLKIMRFILFKFNYYSV